MDSSAAGSAELLGNPRSRHGVTEEVSSQPLKRGVNPSVRSGDAASSDVKEGRSYDVHVGTSSVGANINGYANSSGRSSDSILAVSLAACDGFPLV